MQIDTTKYKLSDKHYISNVTTKKRIIITSTMNSNMRHVIGWKNRFNGKNKRTTHYTISKSGIIYEHFDPNYYSNFLFNSFDKHSIYISLDNEGWVENNEDKFLTWSGFDYNGYIYKKKWRDVELWVPYSDEQTESLIYLIDKLIDKFEIKRKVVSDNLHKQDVDRYGVVYTTNIDKYVRDVNPSLKFNYIKEKIEKNE